MPSFELTHFNSRPFVRRPFNVEALRLTEDNLDAIAEMLGEVKTSKKGVTYIKIDPKHNTNRRVVELGFWITQKDDVLHFYSDNAFKRNFMGAIEATFEAIPQTELPFGDAE